MKFVQGYLGVNLVAAVVLGWVVLVIGLFLGDFSPAFAVWRFGMTFVQLPAIAVGLIMLAEEL